MGKKKGKRANNKFTNSPMSSPSPMVMEKEVEIPLNKGYKDHPPKHAYKTVFMSHENVTSSGKSAENRQSDGLDRSRGSSYQQLIDGGAYEQFHTSNTSIRSKTSKNGDYERESAGDRVIAGSRSISHRSLFSDVEKPSRSFQYSDFGDDQIRISRADGENSLDMRRPYTRSRTVSSSSRPVSSYLGMQQPVFTSQKEIDGNFLGEDVRTYHAGSEYLQNRLSKLSIHSNNDEFVLVGGHPPAPKSNDSRASEAFGDHTTDEVAHTSMPRYGSSDLSGQEDFRASKEFSQFYPPSESSHTNTDDRLLLAARYSQSPEAEGLLRSISQSALSSGATSQTLAPPALSSAHSRSTINEKVGFVEMPTLFSHPDDNFNGEQKLDEPGEPFRPTSEHKSTPTSSAGSRSRLDRSRFSSSSSLEQDKGAPTKALLVTSALTPVIPKRHHSSSRAYSLSRSNESIAPETPQTVQRVQSNKGGAMQHERKTTATTSETAVQTGDSIRLRQNPCFGGEHALSVLSERAYLPPLAPTPTSSIRNDYKPSSTTMTSPRTASSSSSTIFIPSNKPQYQHQHEAPPQKTVEIPVGASPLTTFRSRLRNISDRYSSIGGASSVQEISIPSPTETSASFKKPEKREIFIPKSGNPIEKPVEMTSGRRVEIPAASKEEISSGDTIRKHVPRGRIRDLANAFNRMDVGSPLRPASPAAPVAPVVIGTKYEVPIERPVSRGEKDHRSSSSRLTGSSSTALFRSSTQTLPPQSSYDERRRSTSSSLQNQPHVFTRNTFLSQSSIKPKEALTSSRSQEGVGYHYQKEEQQHQPHQLQNGAKKSEDVSRASEPHKFVEYATKFDIPAVRRLEVPISTTRTSSSTATSSKKRMVPSMRAKTQEVSPFVPANYESRAASGDLSRNEHENLQKMLQKPSFGRETAEDLSRPETLQPVPTYITTTTTHTHHTEYQINRGPSSTSSGRGGALLQQPYSPPVTEDAGSRITHNTALTTTQDDLFAHTEDSSIRGKIDRMFDFVESDDSRKTVQAPSHASTDTIGTSNHHHYHHHQHQQQQHNNHNTLNQHPLFVQKHHLNRYDAPTAPPPSAPAVTSSPYKEKPLQETSKLQKTPERRATITGCSDMEHFDSELEYSLSQYREMQREQLRRRLPSADEPQFFRSPLLSAAHAGQSMHAYRTKDFLGAPAAGEKVRIPSTSSSTLLKIPLATSTPIDSPQSRTSFTNVEIVNNNTTNGNHTFVSSISGVSAIEKHADVMRKINRLSYMIENTQKQMSMNEAALADALKKGRRSQEIAAHRSILISRETLRLQRSELRRLHAFSAVRRPPPPVAKELRGSVVFKNLAVQLNKLFVSRLTTKDDNSYSFVGLFKFGHQVEATELVPLRVIPGAATDDRLYFEKQIQFSDVPIDFMVSIEIYAMRITPAKPVELSIGSSLANKCKSLMGPPQKKSNVPSSTETAFKFRGRLVLDRDAAGDRCLYLDDVTYPLEGTVMITTTCSRLPEAFEVDFRGFLTMFHTVSNMASWERYWAVLRRGVVLFWKYPDDEQMGREPKMQIDLTKCTNNCIEKCGFDLCPRANSFAIEILVDTEDGTIGSVVEKKRVLLSTDSSELMGQWLFTLNQTLDVIRGPI